MTYKPCTTAQYRIMEYLRETFETSLCLIYPSRPNAMVLEDQFGEKLEFIIYRLHGYESSDYDDMHSNSYLAGCDSYIHLASTTQDACRLMMY